MTGALREQTFEAGGHRLFQILLAPEATFMVRMQARLQKLDLLRLASIDMEQFRAGPVIMPHEE